MSRSEFNFSAEGTEISDHQKLFKFSKIKKDKIKIIDQKIVVQRCHINYHYKKNLSIKV